MTLTVHKDAELGDILADESGRTLYLYTLDGTNQSNCKGGCAQAWPPLAVQGSATTSPGVFVNLVGTTKRSDGSTQATYNGHPLYYYSGDHAPGDVNGQGVGNVWYAVTPAGQKAGEKTPTPPASRSESTSSGKRGYSY